MKIVALLFLCLFFAVNGFAQIESAGSVEEVALARDDGSGKPGAATDKFSTTDNPIHCVIQLDSSRAITVKMILTAVKVVGLKPETKSVSVSYTTNGSQNQVSFTASPNGVWSAGSYRADIYLDGVLAKSLPFEIVKSQNEIAAEKSPAPKNFVPRKVPKKPRRN